MVPLASTHAQGMQEAMLEHRDEELASLLAQVVAMQGGIGGEPGEHTATKA